MCKYNVKSYSAYISYDFDKDGFIRKEDVRLILSHVPIDKAMIKIQAEGRFTMDGGGG